MRRRGITFLVLATLAAAVFAFSPNTSGADHSTALGATLPSPRYYTSSVWTGQYAYVFGGYASGFSPASDEVVRYDPATNSATTVARLPATVALAPAVWDGSRAYLFGGTGGSDRIVAFDPATNTSAVKTAKLPTPRNAQVAAWDGTNAYIFGGYQGGTANGGYTNQILRYTPSTDTLTMMSAKLPPGPYAQTILQPQSAVSDGQDVYLFGASVYYCSGSGCSTSLPTIMRYSPATDTITILPSVLPKGTVQPAAVWSGSAAYVIGGAGPGSGQAGTYRDIVRFVPSTGTVTTMAGKLNSGRWGASAVWTGLRAYIFGGVSFDEGIRSDVLSYDPATDMTATHYGLPTIRSGSSAVSDGTYGYIIGGERHSSTGNIENPGSQIVRYDPVTGACVVMRGHLPSERSGTSSVITGSDIYIFGGDLYDAGLTDQIVRYNIATDTVTVMNAKLPTARYGTSAIWTGTYAYIFGGWNWGSSPLTEYDTIHRYDPATDTVTTMNARLPAGRKSTAAVWTGTRALIFGGYPSNGSNIASYDPITDSISLTGATIPSIDQGMGAVWDGQRAYLFGGLETGVRWYNRAYSYDPSTNTLLLRNASLPIARWKAATFLVGNLVYVAGGCCPSGSPGPTEYLDILRYDFKAGAPPVIADGGPDRGQITLSWSPPPDDSHRSPVLAYNLYRGVTSSSVSFLLQVPGTQTSYSETGLADGEQRFYQVQAITADGVGDISGVVVGSAPVLPTVPLSFAASSGPGAGEISLSWSAPANRSATGPLRYRIYRGNTSGTETFLTETSSDVTSFRDTGVLPNGATRFYQVSAANVVGESGRTAERSAASPVPPSAPRNVTGSTSVPSGNVNVSWTAPASSGGPPIVRYRIFRSTFFEDEAYLGEVAGTTLTFSDTTCYIENVTCTYTVTASNTAFEGPHSAGATVAALKVL